jgi:hypothetical protein
MARSTPRPGESEDGLLEILGRGDHDAFGAVYQRALLLARSADRSDNARAPPLDRELGGEEADTAANGIDQHRFSRLDPVDCVEHVVSGQWLHRESCADLEGDIIGQGHQHVGGRDCLLGVGASLLEEGRDAVAELHTADAGSELDTVPEISRPSTSG